MTYVKLKTSVVKLKFKLSLCDYSDAYITMNGTITVKGAGVVVAEKESGKRKKGLTFKNCSPFTDWISEINNTQVDNARHLDVVNLIEYSVNYSKAPGSLCQYYRDELHNYIVSLNHSNSKIPSCW